MKPLKVLFSLSVLSLVAAPFFFAQNGPPTSTDTVARPRKKGDSAPAAEEEQPKIPSKFSKKESVPVGTPTFSTDATTISVDVAVIDSRGNFIPKIPKEYFRILEDNVPQKVNSYSIGEAPMTVARIRWLGSISGRPSRRLNSPASAAASGLAISPNSWCS